MISRYSQPRYALRCLLALALERAEPNCGLVPLRRRLTQLPWRIRRLSAALACCWGERPLQGWAATLNASGLLVSRPGPQHQPNNQKDAAGAHRRKDPVGVGRPGHCSRLAEVLIGSRAEECKTAVPSQHARPPRRWCATSTASYMWPPLRSLGPFNHSLAAPSWWISSLCGRSVRRDRPAPQPAVASPCGPAPSALAQRRNGTGRQKR